MFVQKWLDQFSQIQKRSLRFRLFTLIFISTFPGTLLLIHSIITQQHHEALGVFLIAISSIIAIWFGADILILRGVSSLLDLSKRLSSGDLTARSSQTDSLGVFGDLAQSLDGIATSLEMATEKLKWHSEKGEAFREIVNEFAVQHDITTLLQLIVDKVVTLLSTAHATISLYDASRSELEFVAGSGSQIAIGTRIRMGDGAAGRAAETRQPFIVDQYGLWEGRLPEFESYGFTTLVQVPMVYRDELVGVLGVAETGSARTFEESEILLMKLSAGAAASVIKNARLFDETHRRLQALEAINKVSTALRVAQRLDEMLPVLLEKTMSVINAIMGSIWLYDTADNSLHQVVSNGIPPLTLRFKPGEGIFGTVFSSAQPYFTPNWREDRLTTSSVRSQIPKGLSCAFIPIRTGQTIIGVLMVGFHSPYEFLEDQKHVLSTIAEIAGNAIHRMKLYDQTEKQLQQLNALHQIDLAITGSLDIDNMLQVFLDQVITQLRVDAARVLIVDSNQQTLEFATSRGFMTDALHNTPLRFGEGYVSQIALDQGIIYIADLETQNTNYLHSPFLNAEGFVSYIAVPLVAKSQTQGVLEIFHRSPLKYDSELDFLEALASQAAIMIGYAKLLDDLQRLNSDLSLAYDATLEGWARALEVRDQETKGHSQRVAEMTLRLAKAMGILEPDLIHIHRGALLHDIGKLGVADSILLKAGPLDDVEKEIMQKHPVLAFELLSRIAHLRPALDIPYLHHEKWDGSGYPLGLKGENIPLSARIFAVVDVWDALTSDRPYRKAWPVPEVLDFIREQAGKHFDPQVVKVFLSLIDYDMADGADTEKKHI